MNIRPLLLGLPLLLTGCSSMSNFSWSSLSPFNWFGSSLEVGAKGVGKLNAGTPMSESAINDGLDGNYRLRGGMATSNGQIVSYYQALSGDEVKLVITGEPKGHVQRVDVMDQKVATGGATSSARRSAICTAKRSAPVNRAAAKTPAKWSAWRNRASTLPISLAASGPGRRTSSRRTTP